MLQDEGGLLGNNSFLLQLLAYDQNNCHQSVDWGCAYASVKSGHIIVNDNNDNIGAVVGFAASSGSAARSSDSFNSEGNNSCITSLSDCSSTTTKSLSNTTEASMSSSITSTNNNNNNNNKGEEEQKHLVEAIQGWSFSSMQGSSQSPLLHHAMNQNLLNYPVESLQDLLYSNTTNPLLTQECHPSEESSSRLDIDYNMQYSWGQQPNPAVMGHHFVPKMEMDTWSTASNSTVTEQTGINLSPCHLRQKDIRRVKEEEDYSHLHNSSPQQGSSSYGYLDTTSSCSSNIRPMFKNCDIVDQTGPKRLPSPRFPVTPNLNYRQLLDASSHYSTNNILFRPMSSPQDDHYYASSPMIERKPSAQQYIHPIYADTKPSTRIGGMAYGVETRNTVVDSKASLLPPDSSSPFKRPRVDPSLSSNSILQKTQPRKEKMGDRIAALQQLVAPFGKTDTASVLTEAIKYINYLHSQAKVLSAPYLRSSTTTTSHMMATSPSRSGIEGNEEEEPREDLRSRGLCLVPLSQTMHLANDTAPDYWPPTLPGIFR